MKLIWTASAHRYCAIEDVEPLDDFGALPARSILLLERNQSTVGANAGIPTRIVQQHQRKYAKRLGLCRQQRDEQSREANCFAAQIGAKERFPSARGVALVKDEIDGSEHTGEAIGKLFARRHDIGNARFRNLLLRTHEALRSSRLGLEKSSGDLARR